MVVLQFLHWKLRIYLLSLVDIFSFDLKLQLLLAKRKGQEYNNMEVNLKSKIERQSSLCYRNFGSHRSILVIIITEIIECVVVYKSVHENGRKIIHEGKILQVLFLLITLAQGELNICLCQDLNIFSND